MGFVFKIDNQSTLKQSFLKEGYVINLLALLSENKVIVYVVEFRF